MTKHYLVSNMGSASLKPACMRQWSPALFLRGLNHTSVGPAAPPQTCTTALSLLLHPSYLQPTHARAWPTHLPSLLPLRLLPSSRSVGCCSAALQSHPHCRAAGAGVPPSSDSSYPLPLPLLPAASSPSHRLPRPSHQSLSPALPQWRSAGAEQGASSHHHHPAGATLHRLR
jgi:hypothetical protein